MKRTIQVTDQAGYCFGVRRALDMVKDYLSQETKKVYSLGPIIHNPDVVEELRQKGLIPVDSLEKVNEGVIVIRSHGVEKKLLEEIQRKGLEIVDATCPFVRNAQRLAQKLSDDGYQLVIVGEQSHPEVRGIVSYCEKEPLVVCNAAQLKGREIGPKTGVLAQTTQSQENVVRVVDFLLATAYECRVYNTICKATQSRQTAAVEMASTVDTMFVVGGKNSANTARLAELCRGAGALTYHIESADEMTPEMVRGKERIGIAAGASTPRSHVDAVKAALEKMPVT